MYVDLLTLYISHSAVQSHLHARTLRIPFILSNVSQALYHKQ